MVKLEKEDGSFIYVDDSQANLVGIGQCSSVYRYFDDCVKLLDQDILFNKFRSSIKTIKGVKSDNLYEIKDLLKGYWDDGVRVRYDYVGYLMRYYESFFNSSVKLTDDITVSVFDIFKMPIEYIIENYYGLIELANKLAKNDIVINDLHHDNCIKTKDKIIVIDCDHYNVEKRCMNPFERNFQSINYLFQSLFFDAFLLNYEFIDDRHYIDQIPFDSDILFSENIVLYRSQIMDCFKYLFNFYNLDEFKNSCRSYTKCKNMGEYLDERYNFKKK